MTERRIDGREVYSGKILHVMVDRVTLPDGITEIGASAFFGCEKLRNLRVPSNVTSVGTGAFEGCESIAYYSYGNCSYLGHEKIRITYWSRLKTIT